jgi:hypothetical protein
MALVILVATVPALCGAKALVHQHAAIKSPTGTRAAILAVVAQFEQAYQHRDKKAMLFKLMVPTTDEPTLEKRFQWFRGYGPHDMPGSAHPPILFETSKGSFVPSSYKVSAVAPAERGRWNVTVHEQGTYHDEDGRYKVSRIRRFTITMYKGKWYVMDYVLQENPEDYGFYVDDIIDKMIHVGK